MRIIKILISSNVRIISGYHQKFVLEKNHLKQMRAFNYIRKKSAATL